jgi:hypothetical protein
LGGIRTGRTAGITRPARANARRKRRCTQSHRPRACSYSAKEDHSQGDQHRPLTEHHFLLFTFFSFKEKAFFLINAFKSFEALIKKS